MEYTFARFTFDGEIDAWVIDVPMKTPEMPARDECRRAEREPFAVCVRRTQIVLGRFIADTFIQDDAEGMFAFLEMEIYRAWEETIQINERARAEFDATEETK